jgi:hypothetical protein
MMDSVAGGNSAARGKHLKLLLASKEDIISEC